MSECGSLGLLVSSGGATRACVSSHSRSSRFSCTMRKKQHHGTAKGKTVKITEEKEPENPENNPAKSGSLDDEDQGFGGWLKSADGLETMKLFVIANSIVMLTTIVYPQIQNVYGIISDMLFGEDLME